MNPKQLKNRSKQKLMCRGTLITLLIFHHLCILFKAPFKHIRSNHSTSSKYFSILYFNCRSLLPEIDNLSLLCETYNPDFICVVETWLEPNILDNEILISNYVCIRLDRNRHGGGIALYIKQLSLKFTGHQT